MQSLSLKDIRLYNFKNHESLELSFSDKINCIVGRNGVGKTALLDAVYYLSMCKSYFSSNDKQTVRLDEEAFVLEGIYKRIEKDEHIKCGWKAGQKKVFKRNEKIYERLADHIGVFPSVIIAPKDHELIDGGSELRRKFADQVISQSNSAYLEALIHYNRVLLQRNSLLKMHLKGGKKELSLLENYDLQLDLYGAEIFTARQAFANTMEELVKEYYNQISGGQEEASMSYSSGLQEYPLLEELKKRANQDYASGYTSVGIHKDDLVWKLKGMSLKSYGSQGQQKSFLIALKLAQFDFISKRLNIKPILLLDDIFDKLDAQRVEQLIQLVNTHHYGQIFITDTDAQRTSNIAKRINEESVIHELK